MSVNLGLALAETGKRVVLFDADLQLANLDIMVGAQPEWNLQHVVAGEKTLREVIFEGPGGVGIISGGSGVPALMSAGPKRMATFISQFQELDSDTDYLILDTAAGLDGRVLTFLKLADEVLLVTTPDPASVTDSYATAKILFKRSPFAKIHLLVNMAANQKEAEAIAEAFEAIVWSYLQRHVDYIGFVRHDLQVVVSSRRQRPLLINDPHCLASSDVRKCAGKLAARLSEITKMSA